MLWLYILCQIILQIISLLFTDWTVKLCICVPLSLCLIKSTALSQCFAHWINCSVAVFAGSHIVVAAAYAIGTCYSVITCEVATDLQLISMKLETWGICSFSVVSDCVCLFGLSHWRSSVFVSVWVQKHCLEVIQTLIRAKTVHLLPWKFPLALRGQAREGLIPGTQGDGEEGEKKHGGEEKYRNFL